MESKMNEIHADDKTIREVKINLKLTDEQIEQRIKNIKIPERKLTPYLRRYKEKIFAEHLSKSK